MEATTSRPQGFLDHLLTKESIYSDPYPAYTRLRAEAPVYWYAPARVWLIARYDDVDTVFRTPQIFSSYGFQNRYFEKLRPELREAAPTLELRARTPNLLMSDPPNHTRLRRLLQIAFGRKAVDEMRPRVQAIVDDLLDQVRHVDTVDFVANLAYPLPAMVIADIMGIPREDREIFHEISRDIGLFNCRHTPNEELTVEFARATEQSFVRFRDYLRDRIEARRREPREDLISALVHAEFEGDRLTDEELLSNLVIFLIAGHETTSSLIANALYLFARHPEQLRLVREQRELFGPALDEILRYENPVPRQRRVLLQDTELSGVVLRKGDPAEVLVSSANRDEAKWDDAEKFDITRKPFPHLSFGKGIHYCIGAPVARLEATIALTEVLNRFPRLELPPDWTPTWGTLTHVRSPTSLPLRVGR